MLSFCLSFVWLLAPICGSLAEKAAAKTDDAFTGISADYALCTSELETLKDNCDAQTKRGTCEVFGGEAECFSLYSTFGSTGAYDIQSIYPTGSAGALSYACAYSVTCDDYKASASISADYALCTSELDTLKDNCDAQTKRGTCEVFGGEAECFSLYSTFGSTGAYDIQSIYPTGSTGGLSYACAYSVACDDYNHVNARGSSLKIVQGHVMESATDSAVWGVPRFAFIWLLLGLVMGCFGVKVFSHCRNFLGYDNWAYQKIGSALNREPETFAQSYQA